MQRTTFPEELQAWKKEVERQLHGNRVAVQDLIQSQPPVSRGVVIGGLPPTEAKCLHFDFYIDPDAANQIIGSACADAPAEMIFTPYGITNGSGSGSACCVSLNGSVIVARPGGPASCIWEFVLPSPIGGCAEIKYQIQYSTGGETWSLSAFLEGNRVAIWEVVDPSMFDWPKSFALNVSSVLSGICNSLPTTILVDRVGTTTTTSSTTGSSTLLHVIADLRWSVGRRMWVQNTFTVNGVPGRGSVTSRFEGASVLFDFTVNAEGWTGSASYYGAAFLTDLCRNVMARHTPVAGGNLQPPCWPSEISGNCQDCDTVPTSSTTITSTTSTTTPPPTTTTPPPTTTPAPTTTPPPTTTAAPTTTLPPTTTAAPTSTTPPTTTASPLGRCCFGTPGSEFCTENTQAECEALGTFISFTPGADCTGGDPNPCRTGGSTTTAAPTTTSNPCTGLCNYVGVTDGCGGSPTGYSWSGNGNTCAGSGCGCPSDLCTTVVSLIGWPPSLDAPGSIDCRNDYP